jgi:hypothetical protein
MARLAAMAAVLFLLGVGVSPRAVAQDAKASPGWEVEPYWRPVAGLNAYSSGGSTWVGARMGATGGVYYWKSPLLGRTRATGSWTTGSGVSGLEFRLGSFMGPHQKYWGAEAGVDGFWNRFTADGVDVIPGSVGIDLPVNIHLGPQEFYGLAGITPAILFAPERRVDWSSTDAFGFGHEFAWQLGVGAHLGRFGAALTYSHRVVATGVNSGWGISLSI